MDVDEPRQYQPILAVDHPLSRAAVIPPDERDPVVGKDDIDVPPVSMAGGLVACDDPIGITDYGGAHELLLKLPRRHANRRFTPECYTMLDR